MDIFDFGTHFHIYWSYDQWHKRNLETVKGLKPETDRRYVVNEKTGKKYWHVEGLQRANILKLKETHAARIILPEKLRPEMTGELPPMAELLKPVPLKPDVILRPYQERGVAQTMKFKKCLNGDEQGLGKTIQTIGGFVGMEADGLPVFPCLIVCPSVAKKNWKREWEKFSYKKALVLDSSMKPHQRANWQQYILTGEYDVAIINYESLESFCVDSYPKGKAKNGKKIKWESKDVILKEFMTKFRSGVVDECHKVKDPTTQQARFIMRIFSYFRYKVLLSGTSVVNSPLDLFPQLGILGMLKYFADGTKKGFIDRYCDGGRGSSNLAELNFLLNLHCYFRREKKEVAKDLPDKQRQTILCDISNRAEYDRCEANFQKFLSESGALSDAAIMKRMKAEILMQMMSLKQVAARGKMAEVEDFVNEVLDSGEKLILFVFLREIADKCKELWPHAVTITGADSMEQRDINKTAFQSCKKCRVLLEDHGQKDHEFIPSDTNLIICNYKSAGTAITLTASSRVAFIEYPWTAADCQQCEDRAHRIGQKNNVMCTYFMGNDTIDEKLWNIILTKLETGNAITGATDEMKMEMIDKTIESLFSTKNKLLTNT